MKIHWTGFQQLRPAANVRIALRLRRLAQRHHHDLTDMRILARLAYPHEHGGPNVRIACLVRGYPVIARAAHKDLERALNDGLDHLELAIHGLRGATQDLAPDTADRMPATIVHLNVRSRRRCAQRPSPYSPSAAREVS